MDPQFYREYYTLERSHWWFTARLEILEGVLKKWILNAKPKTLNILNVGVATGATSEMLSKYGNVVSVEYDEECCKFLKEKTGIEAINASLTELPFETDTFDLVCAFDVIEHIEDDKLAISEVNRVLRKDGHYYITVPAFQFLWSNHDVVNHHYRRYTKRNLNSLFSSFKITYSSYFNFWLFFPIAMVRFVLNLLPKSKNKQSSGSDNEVLSSSGLLNSIVKFIFKSERHFLRQGIRFPVGVSIMSIGTKK
ncbi:MAG: class I SAM-dependent methyltransferase [Bacteroidia bacterium]|nr:class I SAM-dependent methyltransferase [Bacteroidia bacterium]NNJ55287.1 class I SAM-dependent methyltransferase [Bacteroidia bacterium]